MPRKAPPRIVQFHTRTNKPSLVEQLLKVPPQQRAQFREAAAAAITQAYMGFMAEYWIKNGMDGALPLTSNVQGQIQVHVNWGRWIVDCVNCNSAGYVDQETPIWICTECGSPENDGKWYGVGWPASQEAIEAELLKRPSMDNRNWIIGQTVADLQAENAAMEIV